MKLYKVGFLVGLVIVLGLFASNVFPAYAAIGVRQPGENAGVQVGGANADTLLGGVLRNAIVLLFTIASVSTVLVFLWGALDWILSGGDKEKVANARKKITNALIGLVLIAVSFLVMSLVGVFIGINPLKGLKIPFLGDGVQSTTQRVNEQRSGERGGSGR